MRLWISRENIKTGIQRKTLLCPIAVAMYDKGYDVSVGMKNIYSLETGAPIFKLNKKAERFVENFDDDRYSVKPQYIYITPLSNEAVL